MQKRVSALVAVTATLLMFAPKAWSDATPPNWNERLQLAVDAYDKGENREAFELLSKLASEGLRFFSPTDPHMIRVYSSMGAVYDEEHLYGYAETCLKQALNGAKGRFGASSVQSVPALINLGQTYVHEGKYSQALPLFKQALAIADKPGNRELQCYVAVIEANIGSMFYTEANYPLAEPHLKRAGWVAKNSLGATHKWTTTIEGMHATCLRAMGRTKEAKALEQAAIAKANEMQNPVSIWAQQLDAAQAAAAAKNNGAAEEALKLAVQAAKQAPAEPMLQAMALTQYGRFLVSVGKPSMAIDKLKAAQKIADETLGTDDDVVLSHAKELADLERSQDQFADAEPLYVRLVKRAKKNFGEDSDQYGEAVSDLAGVYAKWAQYAQAQEWYGKLLVLQEKKFGTDSEKLIPTLVALGSAAQNNTRYFSQLNDTAEGYFKHAADLAGKHFGTNSAQLAGILDTLSRYYQHHFDWDKATKTCATVVAIDEKTFGGDAPETVQALERYAVVLRAAGLRNEAEPIEQRVAKIKAAKSPEH